MTSSTLVPSRDRARTTSSFLSTASVSQPRCAVIVARAATRSRCDRRVIEPGAVDQGHALHSAHPGELAARVAAVGGLDRLHLVPRTARRRGPRAAARSRARPGPSARPPPRPPPAPRRRRPRRPSRRPARRCGRPAPRGPSSAPRARWDGASSVVQIGSASRCGSMPARTSSVRRATRLRSAGSTAAARSGWKVRVQCLRAPLGQIPLHRVPRLRRHRRLHVQVRQRGPQVEARAAHHDRPAALGQQPVDLGVGQLGVAAGAELLGGIDEREQPVLEPAPLGFARRPAQDLQAPVELDRVAVDGDRVLPAPRAADGRARSRRWSCRRRSARRARSPPSRSPAARLDGAAQQALGAAQRRRGRAE